MGPDQSRPRRFRFRVGSLLMVIIIAALLMANLVMWMRLERQRAIAAVALNRALLAEREAVDTARQAEDAIDQYKAQVARERAATRPASKGERPASAVRSQPCISAVAPGSGP
jgi:hypothetical protein